MNKLLIYYLKEEDSGSYECFLSNGQSSEIRLLVNRVKLVDREQDEEQHVNNHHNNQNRNQIENHGQVSYRDQESIKLAQLKFI
jgi:hypothetical protein